MKKLIFLYLILLIYAEKTFSQINTEKLDLLKDDSYQYGFAIKTSIELQKISNFRISIAGGISTKLEGFTNLSPSLHTEIQIYNKGIGSSLQRKKGLYFDFIISPMVTFGSDENIDSIDFHNRHVPLYYFSDLSANPLQNNYSWSFSIGSNYVFPFLKPKRLKRDKRNQKVGFINLMFDRTIQVSYYNDGGPIISDLKIGDEYDRYYSGGIVISYHGNLNEEINQAELSFHKYTGWVSAAYTAAKHLNIDYIPYIDSSAFYYNQSRLKISVSNIKRGIGGEIFIYNWKPIDLQDFLHLINDYPFHPSSNQVLIGGGANYKYVNLYSK